MKIIVKIIISAFAIMIAQWLLHRGVHVEGFTTALLVAIVLAVLNILLKPLLILLTIPATIFTFGLFLLVINAGIIMLTSSIVGSGFKVDGFWWALAFSVILTLVTGLLEGFNKEKKD